MTPHGIDTLGHRISATDHKTGDFTSVEATYIHSIVLAGNGTEVEDELGPPCDLSGLGMAYAETPAVEEEENNDVPASEDVDSIEASPPKSAFERNAVVFGCGWKGVPMNM